MITRDTLRSYLIHRRPGVTSDEDWGQMTVIKEYEFIPMQGKIIMDVGGNIGAFALRAALEGAKEVHTYEPHPSNFDTLVKNTDPFDCIHPYPVALIADWHAGVIDVPLYITNERTLGSCSTTEFRGRTKIMVPTRMWAAELYRIQPDAIKMDCEGAEWELLPWTLPNSVRDVAAELHFTKKRWREHDFPRILESMEEQGFKLLREPKNTGKNFHTIAHWRR